MLKTAFSNPDRRPERKALATWERKSCPLEISEGYRKLFTLFSTHFRKEMVAIGDKTLKRELKVIDRLAASAAGRDTDKKKGKVDDWKVDG